ncbi:MAG: threonine synthase [Minwuiales bacterium]|nr:threonine synthase [Minwuiales bacterium]
MRFVSTRGQAPAVDFEQVLLAGLARDGGLYVPESWPTFSPDRIAAMAGRPYADVAVAVIQPFVGDCIPEETLTRMANEVYAGFDHPAVVPLKQIADNDWLLELFHGPTLAFKDVAMQLLGRLFDHVLSKRGERITVVGATSGDTGPAAIEGCRGREAVDIFILHPHDRVSEVQRRQMTTVLDDNVHNIALEGTFDDCQALLKDMFNDADFRDRVRLSAVNSINWARVMAQIVYYFTSAVALGGPHRPVAFSVPTGNFGDVYAGYAARQMGLPVDKLVVATNRNDIMARFFNSGEYKAGTVHPTISPSMDVQVASNFERYLFDLHGRDPERLRACMSRFAEQSAFRLSNAEMAATENLFAGCRVDEDETIETIADVHAACGEVIDPHTAVGVKAARQCRSDATVPMITLATAHPAKFPDAVERATGVRPALPPRLADLLQREERYDRLANDLQSVETYIADRASLTRPTEK